MEHEAARPRRQDPEALPSQSRMREGQQIRRNPDTDSKKARRRMSQNGTRRTAAVVQSVAPWQLPRGYALALVEMDGNEFVDVIGFWTGMGSRFDDDEDHAQYFNTLEDAQRAAGSVKLSKVAYTSADIGSCPICGTRNRYDEVRQTFQCSPLSCGLQTPADDQWMRVDDEPADDYGEPPRPMTVGDFVRKDRTADSHAFPGYDDDNESDLSDLAGDDEDVDTDAQTARVQQLMRGGMTYDEAVRWSKVQKSAEVNSFGSDVEPLAHYQVGKQCTLCNCPATMQVFGFPVCAYHVDHGEDDPPCPMCHAPVQMEMEMSARLASDQSYVRDLMLDVTVTVPSQNWTRTRTTSVGTTDFQDGRQFEDTVDLLQTAINGLVSIAPMRENTGRMWKVTISAFGVGEASATYNGTRVPDWDECRDLLFDAVQSRMGSRMERTAADVVWDYEVTVIGPDGEQIVKMRTGTTNENQAMSNAMGWMVSHGHSDIAADCRYNTRAITISEGARKVAWTPDESDVTPIARRLMDITNSVHSDAMENDQAGYAWAEIGGSQAGSDAMLAKAIPADLAAQVTQADVDCLEDYNYHMTNRALALLGISIAGARRTAGARVRVTKKEYRGKSGWLISGHDHHDRKVSIFHEHESAARRMADQIRSNPDYDSIKDPQAWTASAHSSTRQHMSPIHREALRHSAPQDTEGAVVGTRKRALEDGQGWTIPGTDDPEQTGNAMSGLPNADNPDVEVAWPWELPAEVENNGREGDPQTSDARGSGMGTNSSRRIANDAEPDWNALSDGRAVGDDLEMFKDGYYDGVSGSDFLWGEPDDNDAYGSGWIAGHTIFEGGQPPMRTGSSHQADVVRTCPNCGHAWAAHTSDKGGADVGGCTHKGCGCIAQGIHTGSSLTPRQAALVDDIMDYESGEMDEDRMIAFFQGLIDSGTAWQLQGAYGRQAQALIDAGLCHTASKTAADMTTECYSCGKKFPDGYPRVGGEIKCPNCGSYEVHIPEAHDNWKRKGAKDMQHEGRNPFAHGAPPDPAAPKVGPRQRERQREEGDAEDLHKAFSSLDPHYEANLINAIATAGSYAVQQQLVGELDAHRAAVTRARAEDRETRLGAALVESKMTPVRTHELHTTATDWIAGEPDGTLDPRMLDRRMATEASQWFRHASPELRDDREEFVIQAEGIGMRVASQFGTQNEEALHSFLSHVEHLWTAERPGQSLRPRTAAGDPHAFDTKFLRSHSPWDWPTDSQGTSTKEQEREMDRRRRIEQTHGDPNHQHNHRPEWYQKRSFTGSLQALVPFMGKQASIEYSTRDFGDGSQVGTFVGTYTGMLNREGKATFHQASSGAYLYLHPDEIVAIAADAEDYAVDKELSDDIRREFGDPRTPTPWPHPEVDYHRLDWDQKQTVSSRRTAADPDDANPSPPTPPRDAADGDAWQDGWEDGFDAGHGGGNSQSVSLKDDPSYQSGFAAGKDAGSSAREGARRQADVDNGVEHPPYPAYVPDNMDTFDTSIFEPTGDDEDTSIMRGEVMQEFDGTPVQANSRGRRPFVGNVDAPGSGEGDIDAENAGFYDAAIAEARRRGAQDSPGDGSDPDLSGEWAGTETGPGLVKNVLEAVGIDPDSDESMDWFNEICDAYEDAYRSGKEASLHTAARALCPECGKPMSWSWQNKAWDCGPPEEGGHGFWDPELQSLSYEDGSSSSSRPAWDEQTESERDYYDRTSSRKTANPHGVGSPAWFDWEHEHPGNTFGPGSPGGEGIPIRGPLTPDMERWMNNRSSSLHTADATVDPAQSGEGVSGLTMKDVGGTSDVPMFPWEMPEDDDGSVKGTDSDSAGAADVAGVPTPGGESGYPQPKQGSGATFVNETGDGGNAWAAEQKRRGDFYKSNPSAATGDYEKFRDTGTMPAPKAPKPAKPAGGGLFHKHNPFAANLKTASQVAWSVEAYIQRVGANMTRQHFEHIADSIATAPVDAETRRKLAEHFGDRLGSTNAQFNRSKFVERASTDPSTIGKPASRTAAVPPPQPNNTQVADANNPQGNPPPNDPQQQQQQPASTGVDPSQVQTGVKVMVLDQQGQEWNATVQSSDGTNVTYTIDGDATNTPYTLPIDTVVSQVVTPAAQPQDQNQPDATNQPPADQPPADQPPADDGTKKDDSGGDDKKDDSKKDEPPWVKDKKAANFRQRVQASLAAS